MAEAANERKPGVFGFGVPYSDAERVRELQAALPEAKQRAIERGQAEASRAFDLPGLAEALGTSVQARPAPIRGVQNGSIPTEMREALKLETAEDKLKYPDKVIRFALDAVVGLRTDEAPQDPFNRLVGYTIRSVVDNPSITPLDLLREIKEARAADTKPPFNGPLPGAVIGLSYAFIAATHEAVVSFLEQSTVTVSNVSPPLALGVEVMHA